MVGKSIRLLKENPVIVLFYVLYMAAMLFIMFLLYPRNMSQFINTDPNSFDFVAYLNVMGKLLGASFLMLVFGILFISGYGYMITEALYRGKTTAASFLSGLNKFFVRVMLFVLLLIAMSMGFSFVASIITIPITLGAIFSGQQEGAIYMVTIITLLLTTFVIPFILLWCPAIFVDNVGVIQGLKNGVKAGVKSYWKLVLLILVVYIPVLINLVINRNALTEGIIFTPGYIITVIITAAITIIAIPIIFIIYCDYRQAIFNQNNINNSSNQPMQ